MGVTATVPIHLELRLTKINRRLAGRLPEEGAMAKVSRNPQGRMRLSASRCGDELLTFFGVRRVRLVASGQIELRRIDGWRKIAAVLGQHTPVAA